MKVYTGDVIMTTQKRELDFIPVGNVKKRRSMSYLEYKCNQYRNMIFGSSAICFILGICIGLLV